MQETHAHPVFLAMSWNGKALHRRRWLDLSGRRLPRVDHPRNVATRTVDGVGAMLTRDAPLIRCRTTIFAADSRGGLDMSSSVHFSDSSHRPHRLLLDRPRRPVRIGRRRRRGCPVWAMAVAFGSV
jgi:hypothetical protein